MNGDRHTVLVGGRWIRVSYRIARLYERFAYRVLGYSVSSTIYGKKSA